MSDPTEFLLARITEDEAMARIATPGPWRHNPRKEWFTDPDKLRAARAGIRQSGGEEHVSADGGRVGVASTGPADESRSMTDADHIARHDPARVLAECEAKRRIVELHAKADAGDWYRGSCRICGESDVDYPCDTLKALALPYAEHSDYRAEWAI